MTIFQHYIDNLKLLLCQSSGNYLGTRYIQWAQLYIQILESAWFLLKSSVGAESLHGVNDKGCREISSLFRSIIHSATWHTISWTADKGTSPKSSLLLFYLMQLHFCWSRPPFSWFSPSFCTAPSSRVVHLPKRWTRLHGTWPTSWPTRSSPMPSGRPGTLGTTSRSLLMRRLGTGKAGSCSRQTSTSQRQWWKRLSQSSKYLVINRDD